ncbi:MAG: hypothetical protein QG582_486 [Candidatus Thermoplasmatota archaeon]|nr:hypothetical protein [Candidatus Thermoplasmatota archaeon]
MTSLRLRMIGPIALFVAGAVCVAASVLSGEADVSLFLIFPVFSGSGGLFLLGVVLIVFSFVIGLMALMMGQFELAGAGTYPQQEGTAPVDKKDRTRYGGVVLIGPVPIAFGSDKAMALAMMVTGIVLAVVALALLLLLAL